MGASRSQPRFVTYQFKTKLISTKSASSAGSSDSDSHIDDLDIPFALMNRTAGSLSAAPSSPESTQDAGNDKRDASREESQQQ